MAMKKLYTFLGVGDYQECIYYDAETGWESSPARFVQIAILELLEQQRISIDEVVVFLTKTSRAKNWEDRLSPSGERAIGLHHALKSRFAPEAMNVKVVEVPEEQVEDALWEYFDKMAGEIEENDHIFLDITHSFRSIPAIALIISNYMRVLKRMKLKGLFYGAFISGQAKVPIYDLTEMLALFEWTQAVDDYLRTGNANMLAEVVESRPIAKKEDDQLRQLAQQLREVSTIIETCRGQMLDDAIRNVKRQLRMLQENVSPRFKPFQKLLDQIEQKFAGYRPGEWDQNLLFIVEWCLKHQLYQQGYTFLQEGILTLMARHAGLAENEYDKRELVKEAISAIVQNKRSGSSQEAQQLAGRWNHLANRLRFFLSLKEYRNNINHCQTLDRKYGYEQIASKLNEYLEETKRLIYQLKMIPKQP